METAEAAQARGDVQTAGAIRDVAGMVASATSSSRTCLDPIGSTVVQQIAELHHVCVTQPTHSSSGGGASSTNIGAAFNIKDISTWPTGKDLPSFAAAAHFAELTTPKDFVTEYCHGLADGPAIRDLEKAYGPGSRKGSKQGYAWRSQHVRKTRALDVELGKRKYGYALIESVGEIEALKTMEGMFAEAKAASNSVTDKQAMQAVVESLMKESEGYAERSAKRSKDAQAAIQRKKAAAPGSASPLPSPPQSPAVAHSLLMQWFCGTSFALDGVKSTLRWMMPQSWVVSVGGTVPGLHMTAPASGPKVLIAWLLVGLQRSVISDLVYLSAVLALYLGVWTGYACIFARFAAHTTTIAAVLGLILSIQSGSYAVAVLSLAAGWLFFMKRYKAAQLTATLATTLVVTPLSELPWSDLRIELYRWLGYKLKTVLLSKMLKRDASPTKLLS